MFENETNSKIKFSLINKTGELKSNNYVIEWNQDTTFTFFRFPLSTM